MRHTPLAVLRSGQRRQLPRGQALNRPNGATIPKTAWSSPSIAHRKVATGCTDGLWLWLAFGGASVFSPALHATLHGHEMGTPSSRVSRASALRPADRWLARGSGVRLPACAGGVSGPGRVGGVTPVERRKGSNRAK